MSPQLRLPQIRGKLQLQQLIDREYGSDVDQFVGAVDREISRLLRVSLRDAGRLVSKFESLVKFLPSRYRPRVFAAQGRLAHWSGNYKEALIQYNRALKAYVKEQDGLNVARTRRGLMDVYMYLGKYNKAIDEGKLALAFFRRRKMTIDAAQTMTNIGNIYHRMDNNRQALKYYDQAREIFAPGGGMPLALVEYNRANVYANLNRLAEAKDLYEYAAKLYGEAGMGLAETQARYSLAYLYFLENKFTEASTVLEQVHDQFESFGDVKSAAVANLDLVEIDLHLNQYGSAVLLGSNLSSLFRKLGMRYEEAKIEYFTAWAHISMGDFKPAARSLKAARSLFQKEGNKLWLGVVEVAFSKMYLGERQIARASEKAESAITLFKQSGDERRTVDAEIALAEVVLSSKNYQSAIELTEEILKSKLVSYQRYRAATISGKAHYALGNFGKAAKQFRLAVDQVEQMLTGLYPDEVQFFFVLDKLEAYHLMVDCLLRLGKLDSALMTTLSGLRTVNSRKIPDARLKKEIPAALLETRERLRAAMNRTVMNPSEGSSTRGVETSLSVEQKIWANERRIRSLQYGSEKNRIARIPRLSEIQASLHDNEVLVTPSVGPDTLGIFRTTRRENRYIPCTISRQGLSVLLRKVHFLLERSVLNWRSSEQADESIDFYLGQLSSELVDPLDLQESEDTLIIMVQDLFSQVPFAALPGLSQNAPVPKEVKLALSPDAVIRRNSAGIEFSERRNSVFGVSSALLPQIDREVGEIGRLFSEVRVYRDEDATVEQLIDQLSRADGFVHIAAHASRSSENPLFSRILMGDGPFFPFDLFGRGVSSALVTLSGCQTAAPGLYYGNSFSLARAFYLAGSKYVLASLWPVSDKFSMIYMTEFYSALHQNADIFDAYRHAVTKVRAISENPAYWGAFILLGI